MKEKSRPIKTMSRPSRVFPPFGWSVVGDSEDLACLARNWRCGESGSKEYETSRSVPRFLIVDGRFFWEDPEGLASVRIGDSRSSQSVGIEDVEFP